MTSRRIAKKCNGRAVFGDMGTPEAIGVLVAKPLMPEDLAIFFCNRNLILGLFR